MKKLIFFLLFLILCIPSKSQSKEIKEKFETYTLDKVYSIDGDNIVVSAVLENLPYNKDELYNKVKSYFVRSYKNANAVLQEDNKENGIIIGKGIYSRLEVVKYLGIESATFSAGHILRVDVKDNRLRIIVSADKWDVFDSTGKLYKTGFIISNAPFTDERLIDKGKQTEAFLALVDKMHESINDIEKTVKEGGLSIENEEW